MQLVQYNLMHRPSPIFWLALLPLIGLTHCLPTCTDPQPSAQQEPDPLTADPFGIINVSSLYGPGSWVAWVLTGFCATFSGSTISIASSILYSATAAIDLIIRCIRIQEDGAIVDKDLGSIAAAYTIVWISLFSAGLVMVSKGWRVYCCPRRTTPDCEEPRILQSVLNAVWTNGYLVIGMLPALLAAGVCVLTPGLLEKLSKFQLSDEIDSDVRPLQTPVAAVVTCLYILLSSDPVSMLAGQTTARTDSVTPEKSVSRTSEMSLYCRVILSVQRVWTAVFPDGIFMASIFISQMVIGYVCLPFMVVAGRTLVFIPYSYYSLFELDQIFALMMGVLGFIWEFGVIGLLRDRMPWPSWAHSGMGIADVRV